MELHGTGRHGVLDDWTLLDHVVMLRCWTHGPLSLRIFDLRACHAFLWGAPQASSGYKAARVLGLARRVAGGNLIR